MVLSHFFLKQICGVIKDTRFTLGDKRVETPLVAW